jgi:DNA-binding CsgD family transcriptional regulator
MQNHKLSKRENEVIELLLQGKSNKQIAEMLGISASTVEFHLKNIFAKLEVHSRTEVILKLGKSTGAFSVEPQESIVEIMSEKVNNKDNFSFKELEMRKRLFYYFLAGIIFGAAYWQYLNGVTGFFNVIVPTDPDALGGLAIWILLSVVFVAIFGVWLIPTIFPALHEFRHSARVQLSALAVIVVWLSAVLGYYLTYLILLAFFGLPNMEYLLIFGAHSPTFWQDWSTVFNKLILFNFLKWAIVSIIVGGIGGMITSSVYSFWIRKTEATLSA